MPETKKSAVLICVIFSNDGGSGATGVIVICVGEVPVSETWVGPRFPVSNSTEPASAGAGLRASAIAVMAIPNRNLILLTGGNGAFTIGPGLPIAAFTDGTSNTAVIAERAKGSASFGAAARSDSIGVFNFTITLNAQADADGLLQACSTGPGTAIFYQQGRYASSPGFGLQFSDGWGYSW
jgi:hypothetical protein